jgi:hypothetical protein
LPELQSSVRTLARNVLLDAAAINGFTKDSASGLADGTITLTFRTWPRPQAKTARTRYRLSALGEAFVRHGVSGV